MNGKIEKLEAENNKKSKLLLEYRTESIRLLKELD